MACPCCGPKWVCYQCCCPDGSDPRPSISITVTPNNFARVNFPVFEGTYTLALDATAGRTDSLTDPTQLRSTCVRYSFEGGAAIAGCRGVFGGLSTYITFQQQFDGSLTTMWGWSGRDDKGDCAYTGGTSYAYPAGTPVANLCGGGSGRLFQAITFQVMRDGGARIGFAAFDVTIN